MRREVKLEAAATGRELAARRAKSRGPAGSRAHQTLMREVLGPLVESIELEQIALCDSARKRKLPKYGPPLLSLASERLALLTLQTMLICTSRVRESGLPPSLLEVALTLGQRCCNQRQWEVDSLTQRDVYALLLDRNRNPWNSRARAKELADTVDRGDWSRGHRDVQLGTHLIERAVAKTRLKSSPMFALRHIPVRRGRRPTTPIVLELTQPAQDWLEAHEEQYALLARPMYPPMIVRPRPWRGLRNGGYLTIRDVDLVKHNANPKVIDVLTHADLTEAAIAVTALQDTPWRVNRGLFHTLENVWTQRTQSLFASLLGISKKSVPPRVEISRSGFKTGVA